MGTSNSLPPANWYKVGEIALGTEGALGDDGRGDGPRNAKRKDVFDQLFPGDEREAVRGMEESCEFYIAIPKHQYLAVSFNLEPDPWRHLGMIWGQDDGTSPYDVQASVLMHLSRVYIQPRCPLMRVGKYGEKGFIGWLKTEGKTQQEVLACMARASELGASFSDFDPQLTLIPGGNVRCEKRTVEHLYGHIQKGGHNG